MIESILWILFTLACLFISGLVLLQEGKGGGLGDAFGGAGAQTFGVKAQGVAKVTGYMIAGMMVLAIVITKMRSTDSGAAALLGSASEQSAPAEPGPADAGGASTTGDGQDG